MGDREERKAAEEKAREEERLARALVGATAGRSKPVKHWEIGRTAPPPKPVNATTPEGGEAVPEPKPTTESTTTYTPPTVEYPRPLVDVKQEEMTPVDAKEAAKAASAEEDRLARFFNKRQDINYTK
eukprot:TRINITY_DN103_c0_g1_i1.p2 TRINITY_DN103_c0_g1~~TRINITY_DN103_c0_g1_i1.p2  ORF type:complete len:127 (-),score=45.40 TRINITY_DN103_c0_g1_i1:169-549(-)